MGQDSVFILPSDEMRRLGRSDWLSVGAPEFWEDPDNEEAHWITVSLSAEMDDTHTDETIITHVQQVIRNRQAIVSDVAQHNQGVVCISIPVPIGVAPDAMWARAEVDMERWLGVIRDGTVTLNREVIFKQPRGYCAVAP